MIWARMLAYITGSVDQELLLRNEYLAAENRVPKAHRQQVRRIEASQILGSSQSWRGNRAVGGADGEGKSRVGL
jgi:putative transposase